MDWHRIPSLSSLRAFEAAARLSSFSRAAETLNVTHAAIAQHVRSLEADLGTSLIVRQGRGVTPTPEGAQLAQTLNAGFEEIASGIETLRRATEERPLTISVTPAFASNWLMPRLGDFWARHPDVPLNISPNTQNVDLVRDGIDLAIRFGHGNWDGIRSEMLTDGSYWLVVHPDLLKGRSSKTMFDLIDLPWFTERNMMERTRMLTEAGVDLETVKLNVLNTTGLVHAAVQSGLGAALISRSIVEREVKAGQLTRISSLQEAGLGYHLITNPRSNAKAMRTFVTWLKHQAKAGGRAGGGAGRAAARGV